MQVPSFLSPFVDGDSPKRLFQGLVVGAVCTMVIGFGWGGWHLGGTVEEMVETASDEAVITALAPICADRFQRAAKADGGLITNLKAVKSWEQDSHLMDGGWATFAGGGNPDNGVADACAKLLIAALK